MKDKAKPRTTPGLRKSIKTKNKLFHEYLNSKCDFFTQDLSYIEINLST